jgi:outer membrane biosynthesis protein TonB
MFDNVGVNNDEEANKRRVYAILMTVGSVGVTGGVVMAFLAYKAAQMVQAVIAPVDAEMVEVQMEDAGPEAPPPPPPPPPPAAAGAEESEESDEVTPNEMTEDVQQLKEEVKDEVKVAAGAAGGQEGGVEGGVAGGVVGGVVGGEIGGQLGGQLGNVRVMHHSELEIKKQIMPDYPDAAKTLDLGDQRCLVKVSIDEEGVPFAADVSGCPQAFHESAKSAMMKWRWYPPKVGKERTKAQTTIGITYKMK